MENFEKILQYYKSQLRTLNEEVLNCTISLEDAKNYAKIDLGNLKEVMKYFVKTESERDYKKLERLVRDYEVFVTAAHSTEIDL